MSPDKAELTACAVFAGTTWFTIVTMRRYSLQALFSYHGWMYDERGKMSFKTKVWSVFMKCLIGSNPHLYSYQSSLPYLPVPAVKDTMKRVRISCFDYNYNLLPIEISFSIFFVKR